MEDSNVCLSTNAEEFLKSLPQEKVGDATLHQYEGFWYPSFLIQSIISFQKHFQVRDGDIIVASKPKSGTTWLKSLVFAITNSSLYKANSQNHPLLTTNSHRLVPFLELSIYVENPCPDFTNIINHPRLFSTHLSYNSLSESIKNNPGCKVVYICRNPFDTFVSIFEFTILRVEVDETVTMDNVFDSFCRGVERFGPFYDHVLQYWNMSLEKPEHVLFLKYEDLKEDLVFQLKRLATFLGFPFTLEEENANVIQDISNLCSFEKLKDLEVNKSGLLESPLGKFSNKDYFRKGKVGDWVNYFTPEMMDRFFKLMEEKLLFLVHSKNNNLYNVCTTDFVTSS